MPWFFVNFYFFRISNTTSSVVKCIAVQDFDKMSCFGNTYQMIFPDDWSEIADDNQIVFGVVSFSNKGKHRILLVFVVDPFKTFNSKRFFIKSWGFFLKNIQISHEVFCFQVPFVFQEMPIQTFREIPFVFLSKFAAHKHEVGSWMCIHIAIQQAQVG